MIEVKRQWRNIGLAIGFALFVGGFALLSFGAPYIEYSLTGFTQTDSTVINTITVGYVSPPVFGGLVFDFSAIGRLAVDQHTTGYYFGGVFSLIYGDPDNFAKIGCTVDVIVGFKPFLGFRLTLTGFPSSVQTGGP